METPLREQHCQACEGGVRPFNQQQIDQALSELPGWSVNDDGTIISRTFSFKNFFRTMSFVNAVAHIANQENHHPDLQVSYNRCVVTFTTHAIKGLSINDFICASKIDQLDDL